MRKSKKKRVSLPNNKRNFIEGLLDNLVQQTLTLFLSFAFSTALIGGSGYILFQLPRELNAIESRLLELDTKEKQIDTRDKLVVILINGWIFDKDERMHKQEILDTIAQKFHEDKIELALYDETTTWIYQSLSRLAIERGQINGFEFSNPVDTNFKQSMIYRYDLEIDILNELLGLFQNWNLETITERTERLKVLEKMEYKNYQSSLESVVRVDQIRSQNESELKIIEQQVKEFKTEKKAISTKRFLSILGITLGSLILYALWKVALKKSDNS